MAKISSTDLPPFELLQTLGAIPRRKPQLRLLEPRVVFDAAGIAVAAEAVTEPINDGDQASSPDASGARAEADALIGAMTGQSGSGQAPEIIFIDGSLPDLDELVSAMSSAGEIVNLDASQDGFEQMAAFLDGRSGIGAIHILSHGSNGEIKAGSGTLSLASISGEHADELAIIKSALAADGDLLIYGCDAGDGTSGKAFVEALATATGSDVAASDDDTGAGASGGDWDLEVQSGVINTGPLRIEDWSGTLSQTNTGNWSVSGNTATNTTGGVTTTLSFSVDAGGSIALNATPQTLNTTAGFFSNSADADASLGFTYSWDTAAEPATGIPQPDAATDAVPMTVTITFSQPVTNPIIHIDRLGGNGGYDPNTLIFGDEDSRSNSSSWTVTTPGATLTKLSGVNHLDVTSTTFQRTPNAVMSYSGISGEASTNASTSTAAGSIQVNGTFTTLTFVVTGAGVEGAGADGIEIGLTIDAAPDANNDSFTVDEDTTLTGNLYANNGSGTDSDLQGDTLTITQINGAAFTAGTPITLANGILTVTNATTGAFTFVPNANYSGGQSFTYTISDANGGTDTATADITVNAVNDAPVAANDGPVTVIAGVPANIAVLGNDTDGDGGALSVSQINGTNVAVGGSVTLASGTVVTRNADSTLGVVMAPGNSDTETFTYTVSDGSGGTDTAAVTLARDSDGDGITNTADIDDDNDGILDTVEHYAIVSPVGTADPNTTGVSVTAGAATVTYKETGNGISLWTANGGDIPFGASTNAVPGFDLGGAGAELTVDFSANVVGVAFSLGDFDAQEIVSIQAFDASGNLIDDITPYLVYNGSPITVTAGGSVHSALVSTSDLSYSQQTFSSIAHADFYIQAPLSRLVVRTEFVNGGTAEFFITRLDTASDSDADGLNDHLDIDSDNDGITDNVEAQATAGYTAPSGTDADGDGLDDAYDATVASGATGSNGLTPVNTDAGATTPDITPDYLDADSDNDGTSDAAERGTVGPTTAATGLSTPGNDADGDGLFDVFEGTSSADGFDVNDENLTGATFSLADTDDDTAADGAGAIALINDLDFRDSNEPPVAMDDMLATNEDATLTTNVITANGVDSDPDSDPLSIVSATIDIDGDGTPEALTLGAPTAMVTSTGTAIGVITVDANGDVTFAPASNYAGPVPSLTYTLSDGNSQTDTAVAGITINDVNDPPAATPSTSAGDEDTLIAVDLTGTDIDGTIASVTVATLPPPSQGVLYMPGGTSPVVAGAPLSPAQAAALVFSPAPNFNGTVTIAFTVTDDDGAISAPANEVITVNDVNDPPTATPSTSTGNEDTPIAVDLTGTDVDGTIASVTVATLPPLSQGVLYMPGGTSPVMAGAPLTPAQAAALVFVPAPNFNGTVTVAFTVTDDDGAISAPANEVITVAPVNDAPDPLNDTATTTESAVTIIAALANDTDIDGPNLQITEINGVAVTAGIPATLPSGALVTIDTAGNITYDPNGAFDHVAPGSRTVDVLTYTLADSDPTTPLNEEAVVEVTITGVIDTITTTANTNTISEEAAAAVSGNVVTDDDGFGVDQPGDDLPRSTLNFGFHFADEQTTINTATLVDGVIVTIGTGGNPALATGQYGTAEYAQLGGEFGYLVIESNAGPANLHDVLETSFAFNQPVENVSFRVLDLDINAALTIQDQVEILAFDAGGAPIAVTIWANTAFTDNPSGATYTGEVPNLAGAVDDGNLYISIAGPVSRIVVNVSSGPDLTTTNPGTQSIGIGDISWDNVTPNPLTVSQIDGVTSTSVNVNGAYGVLDWDDDGSYTYTLNGANAAVQALSVGEILTDEFQYTATDINGQTSQSTLTITITGVNDIPAAQNDAEVTDEDTPFSDNVLTDNGNGADSDVDAADVLGVTEVNGTPIVSGSVITLPSGALLTMNTNGSYTYDPNGVFESLAAGEQGVDTFTYTIDDGNGGTDTATVTIAIDGVNDAPIAQDDAEITDEDTAVSGSVLADNGNGPDSDVDTTDVLGVTEVNGTPITSGSVVVLPSGALLTMNDDGSYTYDPNGAFEGLDVGEQTTDTFTYTVDDGNGGTDAATVTISVLGVNDAPVVVDPTNPGTPANPIAAGDPLNIIPDVGRSDGLPLDPIDVAQYFVDPDGEPLAFAVDPSTPAWLSINPVTGVLTGTPPADASQNSNTGNPGEYLVSITATDPDGAVTTTTVTLTIVNLPPAAQDDANSVGEDDFAATGNVITDLAGADSDTAPDSDMLAVTSAEQNGTPIVIGVPFTTAGGGVVTLNGDGSYSFEPGTAYNGLDAGETATETIGYTIDDGNGGTDSAVLVLTVIGANDAPVVVDPSNPGTPDNPIPASDPLNIIPDVTTTDSATITPIDAGSYVVDPDGEPLTFSSTGLPPGLFIDPITGTISGTISHSASQTGPYTAVIIATDPDGAIVETTVSFDVSNPPPVAVDDAQVQTPEGVAVQIDPLANDSDPDGDPIRVLAATSANGTVTINPDGTIRFEPAPGFAGYTLISYTITDDEGGTATATIPIFVVPTPATPQAPPQAPEPEVAQVRESISVEGALLKESDRINRLWDREFFGTTAAGSAGALPIEPLGSFSIRFGEPGRNPDAAEGISIRIESLVTNGVLTLIMESNGSRDGVHVIDYSITQADGRALPDWLERPSIDMLQGRRAANAEVIELRVRAILSDGREIVQDVRIETPTGEIKPLAGKRAEHVPMFNEQVTRFATFDDRSAEALADMLEIASLEN